MLEEKGKRGFVLTASVLMVIGIIVIGSIILALTIFSSYKWMVMGVGIIVGAFILLANAFKSQGELGKGKLSIILILISIAIIFIFFGNVLNVAFSSTPEVYYPQYGSMQCTLGSSDYLLYEKLGQTQPVIIKCGENMNAYTDYCEFEVNIKVGSWTTVASVAKIEKCNNAGSCIEIKGWLPVSDYFEVYSVNLDTNRDGYLDTKDGDIYSILKVTPSTGVLTKAIVDVRVKGNAYDLIDTQGNNYKTAYSQGCDLAAIPSSYHVTKAPPLNYQDSSSQVPFRGVINYVWGMNKGVTSNVIMKNGKWVYIENAGYYLPILTATDGYNYVDWQAKIPDASIQCVPSNIFVCNADATLRPTPSQNVEGQDCSLIRGINPVDFYKASNGKCCKFNCVSNKIVVSECQDCKVCASGESYSAQTNTCVTPTSTANTNIVSTTDKCDKWYQVQGTKTTVIKSWYNYLGIGTPTIVTTPQCETAGLVYLLVAGTIILILGIFLIVLWRPPKNVKGVKKK